MKHALHFFLPLIALCMVLAACGGGSAATSTSNATPAAKPVSLNIFAAASLTESFNAIKTQYQAAHPNVKLTYNFNGSQLLAQQIISGAPADVFASADQTNMKKVSDPGLVENPQVFVKNKLVVIIPGGNPGKINTLKDLANKGVKIDIEAPAVPAGKYSLQVLDKMGRSAEYGAAYERAVKANFVSQEENVKAVVQKVQLGEADAGFVYQTDVTSAVANKVKVLDIPENFNVLAQYPIAVVKNSPRAADAQAFVQYILSSEAQAIFAKYRFISASGSGS